MGAIECSLLALRRAEHVCEDRQRLFRNGLSDMKLDVVDGPEDGIGRSLVERSRSDARIALRTGGSRAWVVLVRAGVLALQRCVGLCIRH